MKTTQCCMTLSRDPQNTRIQSNQKRRSAVALQAVVTNKRKQNNLKKGRKKKRMRRFLTPCVHFPKCK